MIVLPDHTCGVIGPNPSFEHQTQGPPSFDLHAPNVLHGRRNRRHHQGCAALDTGIEDEELDLIEKPLSLDGFLGKVREVLDR